MNHGGSEATLVWIPSHQGIAGNEKADRTASDATHKKTFSDSYTVDDAIQIYKQNMEILREEERENVTDNWLRSIIRTSTKSAEMPSHLNRHEETVITRLRLGHTRYTHEHIRRGLYNKYCEECEKAVTLTHLITSCKKTIRHIKEFNISKEDLYDQEQIRDIIEFTKRTELFYLL